MQTEPSETQTGAEIVTEAGTGEAAAAEPGSPFAKALEILEAADKDGEGAAPAEEAPVKEEVPAAEAKGEDKGDKTPDVDALFKEKFDQYRREYGKLDAERKELKEELKEFRTLKASLAEARYNPNKLLEVGGVTQEEFTRLLLTQGGEMTPEMRVALEAKQRADASEKQVQSWQQAMQEKEQQQILAAYKAEAQAYVESTGEEHEFLQALGTDEATQMVMNEINTHHAEHRDPATGEGPVLSYKEAADRIEKRIEQRMFDSYIKTKKLQAKFQEVTSKQRANSRTPRTITSSMTPATSSHPTSERDRMDAALKIMHANWQ